MIIGRTKSVCPVCLRVLDAEKRVGRDGIYLDKNCPEHGQFSALIWEGNMASYLRWNTRNSAVDPPKDGRVPEKGCPLDCGLCTEHLRKGCCVLLELTKRCNLRCPVCFASAGEAGEDLFRSISRVMLAIVLLYGVYAAFSNRGSAPLLAALWLLLLQKEQLALVNNRDLL